MTRDLIPHPKAPVFSREENLVHLRLTEEECRPIADLIPLPGGVHLRLTEEEWRGLRWALGLLLSRLSGISEGERNEIRAIVRLIDAADEDAS